MGLISFWALSSGMGFTTEEIKSLGSDLLTLGLPLMWSAEDDELRAPFSPYKYDTTVHHQKFKTMAFEGRRYLPEELHEKIQLCLPTKSLVRFESVCKSWQSRFANLYHLVRGGGFELPFPIPERDLLSMVPELDRDTHLPPPLSEISPWKRDVLGTGILCLISIHRPLMLQTNAISPAKFTFLNPVTSNYICTNPIPPQFSSAVPLSGPSEAVFGFGTLNSDYRVAVLVRYGSGLTSSLLLVYSLLSGQWKNTASVIPQDSRISRINCGDYGCGGDLFRERFVSGCWHWTIRLNDGTYRVMSFNFGDEKLRLIGMPEPLQFKSPTNHNHESKTVVLQGRLAVVDMVCRWLDVERIEVWVMTEYGAEESWRRVYRIDSPLKYSMVINFLHIDCRKDARAAAGFVVGSLFFTTLWLGRSEIICCDDNGCHRVLDPKQERYKIGLCPYFAPKKKKDS